jgi:hypothetical protein
VTTYILLSVAQLFWVSQHFGTRSIQNLYTTSRGGVINLPKQEDADI